MKDNKKVTKATAQKTTTRKEGQKDMKKEAQTATATTRTEATEKARMMKESKAQLEKWAAARHFNVEGMKKEAIAALLATDNMKAAKAATEGKKDSGKKEKKTAAQKPQKKEAATAAHVGTTPTLKAEVEAIGADIAAQNGHNESIAAHIARIVSMELYKESGADSMKAYVNDKCGGKLHGMTYTTINTYRNAAQYVYILKDESGAALFAAYGMHLIQALIVPCRYHSAAVLEAVKADRIRATMSLKTLKDIITTEGWTSPRKEAAAAKKEAEATAEAEAQTDNATAYADSDTATDIDAALDIVYTFIEDNNGNEDVVNAFNAILKALDK